MMIFTYMDNDQDSVLKYRDFCNLCAENVGSVGGTLSFGDSSIAGSKGGSDFSKIISSLKSKNSSNARGRGGPNFKSRGASAGGPTGARNFNQAKTIEQVTANQPFVSSEIHRFMVNM